MVLAKSILRLVSNKNAIKKLLIAEDSDTDFLLIRRKMIKLLEPEIIERASNRSELVRALLAPHDLIVTDLHLLDIADGDLLRSIHNAQPTAPCLVMTGSIPDDLCTVPANVIGVVEKGDNRALEVILEHYRPDHAAQHS